MREKKRNKYNSNTFLMMEYTTYYISKKLLLSFQDISQLSSEPIISS